jgi:DNA polymerase
MTDAAAERSALLAQIAGYLEWEQELGGSFLPSIAVPPPSAARASAPARSQVPAPGQDQVRAPAMSGRAGLPLAHGVTGGFGAEAAPPSGARVQEPELTRRLALIEEEVRSCTRCELHKGRTHTVFARGTPQTDLVFVGEGPGQEEDRTGQPFVGPAGQLLDKMVAAMGLARDAVYICNVVKCRPPGNRTPLPSETGACAAYLEGQLDLIRPRVIVALGRCAAENMGLVAGGGWRGRWGRYRGYDVMPTYHPAFLLRSPEFKRPVWEDLQRVMARLKEPR